MIKKTGKYILNAFLFILAIAVLLFVIFNESRPKGIPSLEADALATKMLTALNHEAYRNTRFLEWSFANGKHQYLWDKEKKIVEVSWDAYTVTLNLDEESESKVLRNNIVLSGKKRTKSIEKARTYFNNDSFWLVAPYKIFDPGTERSLVPLDDGSQGLLVTYTTGGDTPGDSYLWILDSKGVPERFKLWVKIIPIGGLEATWEGWQVMDSGAMLPTMHHLGPFSFGMGAVKGYNTVTIGL